VDHRRHGHAEGRRCVVGLPGGFRHVGEVLHARQISERHEAALIEEVERGIERTAGDEVARRATRQARIQRGIVLGRRIGLELNVDIGVLGFEGGDDLVVPDVGIVVPPALDGKFRLGQSAAAQRRKGKRGEDRRPPGEAPCFM
jgi:hypothetical protein